MATKQEAQNLYDGLRRVLIDGKRRALKITSCAAQADAIVAQMTDDPDMKTKVQACIDAGPESLTALKADAKAIRDIATVVEAKYPDAKPLDTVPDPDPEPDGS